MARSTNSQLAVDLYDDLLHHFQWSAREAWQGIARLLLSCEVYRYGWVAPHDVVSYVESNRLTASGVGPNATLKRAKSLSDCLADQLNISRSDICRSIGTYWRQPQIRESQPNNLVGRAFRSLVVNVLQRFGDPSLAYEEWADAPAEFPVVS